MTRSFASPRRHRLLTVVALLGTLALGACKADKSVTTIKTLLDDPTRFDGQVVRVVGDVGKAVGVLGYGAYQINDGTGTLDVITKTGGAPREGAKVGVEGTFKAVFTLGTTSVAALQEIRRYTP
jgi:hypothetical protein